MTSTNEPQDSSEPGVLSDGSQIGHPENRDTKTDLKGAFKIAGHPESGPLIAADLEFEPASPTTESDDSAPELGSSQLVDIADGGEGHARTHPPDKGSLHRSATPTD